MNTTPTDTQVRDLGETLHKILNHTLERKLTIRQYQKVIELVQEMLDMARAADRAYLAGEIEKLNRTDDTQMSEDRIYDEALEDVLAIINTTQK